MPIDLYHARFSAQSRAVLLTAKALKLDVNVKSVNFGDAALEAINPAKSIPSINDGGFVLWEGKAIQQYLVNQYAPDSKLYPKDPKERAVVDRWLNFDATLSALLRDIVFGRAVSGIEPSEQKSKQLRDQLELLEKLIGDNKYLNGKYLTIADLSALATPVIPRLLRPEPSEPTKFPNLKRYHETLSAELPYYDEVNKITPDEAKAFIERIKERFAANK